MVRAARARARLARRDITLADLADIVAEQRPALPAPMRHRVAVHEAGHALVGVATGIARPTLLALRADGGVTEAAVTRNLQDAPQLAAHLAIDLAGRAAERLVFGQPSAGSGGDQGSDLAKATQLAAALETSLGLGGSLVWLGPPDSALARLNTDAALRARVEQRLVEAEARATRILQANRPLLEAIAADLCAAGLLDGPRLAGHLAQVMPEAERGLHEGETGAVCTGSVPEDGSDADAGPTG
jgi:ATP-dependent Zn protease